MNDISLRISDLKHQRDAVILAHYYVDGAVQDIADYVGDSYYLSRVAKESPHPVIVYAGVRFMAESAKIMSPEKTILMPDPSASCPMAHMVNEKDILAVRARHEDLTVVCYINSTTLVKAYSDVCVTSSNAVKVVSKLSSRHILFIPDRNLGSYIAGFFPDKSFLFLDGFCPIHNIISANAVRNLLSSYPEAKVLAHPECRREVLELADYVGSTSGIIYEAARSDASTFIVCTEEGVRHQLMKDNPSKTFHFPVSAPICPDMKKITLDNLAASMEHMSHPIEIDENIRQKALGSLIKMHELAG
ncbi:MAG: quinolinate synthase NadA [Oscillospiraceae bacterium]|nr:quinolinate synthase NadA [Oscillospiraceae bacterium]